MTDNATAATEWRYYLRDGGGLVRQTADETAAITLAWTFSPDGGVVLGEEGPVTHLGCGDNAVYDWSTGLIFKNGRYFDPRLGLWLLAPFMIVFGLWRPRRRRKGRKRSPPDRFYTMLLLLLVVALPLAGCDGQQTPTPTPTCTPTPTPGLPGDTPNPPTPTPGNPSTPTPGQPTPTPGSPDTPTPGPQPPTQPPTNTPTPDPTNTPPPGVEYLQLSLAFLKPFGVTKDYVSVPIHTDPYTEDLYAWEAAANALYAEQSSLYPRIPIYSTQPFDVWLPFLEKYWVGDSIGIVQTMVNRRNSLGRDIVDEVRSGQYAYGVQSRGSLGYKDFLAISYAVTVLDDIPDLIQGYMFFIHVDTNEVRNGYPELFDDPTDRAAFGPTWNVGEIFIEPPSGYRTQGDNG